jgi:hypothetical protein
MNLNWILAGLLACGFVMGWRKGLFRIISGLAGMIISFYVAFLFNPSLAAIIDESIGFTHRVALFISKYLSVSPIDPSSPAHHRYSGSAMNTFLPTPVLLLHHNQV